MHKSFSGDNVTCRRAVLTCQADFSSLLAPILKTYLKDLHSLLLSYLNSRNCHCFPLVPNIFTSFSSPPLCSTELSLLGATQGNFEDLILLRLNQRLTGIFGLCCFHAPNFASVWAVQAVCLLAGHWRSWLPRGSQCWTGIPLGQTHLWTCKMGSLQCYFKGQPARFVWQHWGWLPASCDLCGPGLWPNTDNADWKGLGKVYPNTANTEPLMFIILFKKGNFSSHILNDRDLWEFLTISKQTPTLVGIRHLWG